ncbi:hypothetical protein EKO04_010609 [Ascochyta lentis]|uniref:DUF7704 domain-containing protein n=1 Tax=Ascochyta lentis TaxID=205686 RepID=A0A8H7MDU7_9PLEO|nr:hypothetical protein EKO04_010609 [Ascochyta lentis]
MPRPYVHSFYRIWFTIVDPTVLFFTVLACIFSPATILETVAPPSIEPYRPLSHGPLLHQTAALFGFLGIMFAVLLRASPDPKVWKIVQGATLGVDLALLATFYNLLRSQNRLEFRAWSGVDWVNIGFTVWVGLIRVAYLSGVGGDREKKDKTG